MTEAEKLELVALFGLRAELAGLQFSPQALVMLVQDISDLSYQDVAKTIQNWGRSETGFPYPAKVRAKVMPELDDGDDAQIVSNLIPTAVSRFGYTNQDKAREFVGELGWEIVKAAGGWKHICDGMTIENESIIKAQLRELAKTVSKRAKRGELNETPSLPSSSGEIRMLVHSSFKEVP